MKTNILYFPLLVLLSAVSLCGCSNDDEPVATATDGTTLTVTARADGFASTDGTAHTGTPQTRASESGYTTTFVKGDQIGVFAVRDGSVITGCQNMPLTYNGTSWSGSAPVYKYADATYFAYYPYTDGMNNKTSVDEIVTAFNATVTAATDQSTYAKYTACDLMTATAESPISGTSLSFSFTHKMSLIEISLPVQKYKTTDNADAYEYSAPVLGATFSLAPSSGSGATTIKPCPMGNGIYRYIVPVGTSGATVSGAFDTADGKTIEYSKNSLSLSAGNYKRLNVTYNGATSTPTVRTLTVGDFFYSDGSICPGDASNPPKEGCIGIVYWLGDIKGDNYTLLDSQFPSGTHGLVVSLWDMPAPDNPSSTTMKWTYGGYEYVNTWLGSATWSGTVSRPGSFTSIQVADKMQGYANTVALEEYNKYVENPSYSKNQNLRVKPVKGLSAFQTAHPAPVSSSGWYWPSVCELKQGCWGQGNSSGVSGKSMLNPKITKVGGTTFGNDYYWPSTENSTNSGRYAWLVIFSDGTVGYVGGYKYSYAYRVRPLLAF